MYVHEACNLARAAQSDGLHQPSIHDLAKCGAFGASAQNELRDLHRLHDRMWGVGVQPQIIKLTLKNENRAGNHVVDLPVIAPYEMFHHLYNNGNFSRNMVGDGCIDLAHYWSVAMRQPWAVGHPLKGKPHLWKFAIPIVWFTDGAEFAKGSQTEGVVFQWSSAVVEGISSMESKYLAAFLIGDTFAPETNDELVAYLCWCGQVLLDGKFPASDFYDVPWPLGSWRWMQRGKSIAGPCVGAFCAVTHDAKARYLTHKFVNFYNCNYICESCMACSHIQRLTWTNFRSDAPWRKYRVTHEQYMDIIPAVVQSPWAKMPRWHLSRCLFDWMHCNHLGVGRDATAQVAVDLCKWGYLGPGTLDEQLQLLWVQYRRWCKRLKMPFSRRRFSCKVMGVSDEYSYPEMNGRTKAAHIKPLVHFLAHRAKSVIGRNAADTQAESRAWMIWGLAEAMYVCDTAGFQQLVHVQFVGRSWSIFPGMF